MSTRELERLPDELVRVAMKKTKGASSKSSRKTATSEDDTSELRAKRQKVRFDWIKPFDKIAFYASRQSWLPG